MADWAELRILIPGEPVPKERPQVNHKTGNVYTPKATKDAERATAWAMRQVRGRRPMFQGEVDVELFFGLGGQRRKADVDYPGSNDRGTAPTAPGLATTW